MPLQSQKDSTETHSGCSLTLTAYSQFNPTEVVLKRTGPSTHHVSPPTLQSQKGSAETRYPMMSTSARTILQSYKGSAETMPETQAITMLPADYTKLSSGGRRNSENSGARLNERRDNPRPHCR